MEPDQDILEQAVELSNRFQQVLSELEQLLIYMRDNRS